MFWAFTSGVAKTLREEMQREELAEDERLEWERRLQLQQKIQEEAEKRRKASEEIFREYDPKSGKFVSMTRDGARSEYDAPEGYKEEYAEKKRIEEEDRQNKLKAQQADDDRANAQLGISQSYLGLQREQLEETKKNRGLAEAARGEKDKETALNRELEAVSKLVPKELQAAKARILTSGLSPEQKIEALKELANATL
jgi:hypothetical protein